MLEAIWLAWNKTHSIQETAEITGHTMAEVQRVIWIMTGMRLAPTFLTNAGDSS